MACSPDAMATWSTCISSVVRLFLLPGCRLHRGTGAIVEPPPKLELGAGALLIHARLYYCIQLAFPFAM